MTQKNNKGKKFENKFKNDWNRTVGNLCIRLKDAKDTNKKDPVTDTSKLNQSTKNPSDFICYKYPYVWLVECKSHLGNTLPFTDIRQYDEMLKYEGIEGIIIGVVAWMRDHDKVVWIPLSSLKKMKEDGKKSFNIKYLSTGEYKVLDIPGNKLRVYIDTDYSWLVNRSLEELI